MATVDYLPIATGGGANVESQGSFAGSGHQTQGFSSGIALSAQLNKCWRQSSMIAAAIANFVSNTLGINVLDDGNLATLITNLTNALKFLSNGIKVVTFSATPTFDVSLGLVQEITLTGNVTSSTLANSAAGQIIKFVIHQDGTGGHTFAWPSNVPGAPVEPQPNATTIQAFLVDNAGVLHPYVGESFEIAGLNFTPVTVNANTNSAQNLMSFTIPAGLLNKVGKIVRLKAFGQYVSQSSAETVTLDVSVTGGIYSSGVATPIVTATGGTIVADWKIEVELIVMTLGVPGTVLFNVNGTDLNTGKTLGFSGSISIDTTAAGSVQFSIQFSAASVANSGTQNSLVSETAN